MLTGRDDLWGAMTMVLVLFNLRGTIRLAALTGEPRSLTFLRQRLGIAMMRGNAAAIRGTLPDNISSLAP